MIQPDVAGPLLADRADGDGLGLTVLSPVRSSCRSERRWRAVTLLWATLLAGYALLDKGFAYFGVPGTPIFVGELLVVAICALVLVETRWFSGSRLVPLAVLAGYCGWGLLRMAEGLPTYRLDAVRDAALWYYAIFAAFAVAWFRRSGPTVAFACVVRFVERLMIPMLIWTPFAVLAERAGGRTVGPDLLGNGVPILTHKPSNLSPLLAMIALYAWHYPSTRFGPRARLALFVAALVDLAIVGTQTRGGFVAGLLGLAVGTAMLPRRLRLAKIAKQGISVCVVVFLIGFALDLRLPSDGRDLSVRQLTNNTLSIAGKAVDERADPARGTLDGNVEWRLRLWTTVLRKTYANDRQYTGWGFGPNLGDEMGFENQLGDGSLRSPHNSHLSVFARMGYIGAFAWLLLWATWCHALAAVARERAAADRAVSVAAAMLIGILVALHVNAYFDPAYESPQAAAWLWAVFGVGCGLLLVRRERSGLGSVDQPLQAQGATPGARGSAVTR